MRIFLIIVLVCSSLVEIVRAQHAPRDFVKATRAANARDYRQALEHYRTLLGKNQPAINSDAKFSAKIHFNIGVCLYHLKQPAEAIEEYSEAIKLQANYQKAFRAQAMAYLDLKNWRGAQKAFTKAIALDNCDGESWFDLGMLMVAEKDYDRAAAAFRQVITNKSVSSPAAHSNLGVILALNKDFQAAETEFETSLSESNGTFVEAKNNLEFCRAQRANQIQGLRASLQFSVKNQTKN